MRGGRFWWRGLWGWVGWLGLGWLVACVPLAPSSPLATPWRPTATATPTATPTQVPFPPTSTPTPLPPTPLLTPTPDPWQGVDALAVEEDFRQPDLWQPARLNKGQVTLGAGMLSLSVPQGPGYASALRQEPDGANQVVEAVFQPRLCRPEDLYGLLLRANPQGTTAYRISLSCGGEVFAEYVQGAAVVPLTEHLPVALPTGPPVRVPLTVRLEHGHLWVYVHGQLVLEATYRGRYRGLSGAFVRATTADPLAVDVVGWRLGLLGGRP